jgi:hypothetical protein
MRRALLAILVLLGSTSPAAAWDPDAPAEESQPDASFAAEAAAGDGAPGPSETPEGIYYVTETYVRDVVTNSGNTTTYSTETVSESTGSYARVLGSVGTGERSVLDGTAFNGRSAFADGTPVAGTYYENFVLTPDGFVSVSIVFFQDDSVTRRSGGAPSAPASPEVWQGPEYVPPDPFIVIPPDDRDRDTDVPPASKLTAGIALGPDGPLLRGADVLRGREAQFWPRAFADGRATAILSWRLLGTPPDYTLTTSGGSDPFIAEWRQMPATPWTLVFEIVASADPKRTLTATITVVVRSPALVQ